MADTSNLYSTNAFDRRKQFSGLHSSKIENRDIYYEIIDISHDPLYLSIISTNVTTVGYGYPINTSITFPSPQHPDGRLATGNPVLVPTADTFTIANPGAGYSINDFFTITHEGYEIGFAYVTSVDTNGGITGIQVISQPIWNYIDTSITNLPSYIDLSNNNTASFTVNDSFSLTSVVMRTLGSGYETGQNNNPQASVTTASPAQFSISYDPQVIIIPFEKSIRHITYRTAYGYQYNNIEQYLVRRNVSLPSP